MKKIFLVLLFAFSFQLSAFNFLYAGWPINRTPRIEGTVTDATTGKPIENVVVNCEWIRGRPSPGGEVRKGIANEIAVTNREGKYIIPSKTSFHFISWFSEIRIHILHPLYETKEATYFSTNNPHFAEGIYETMLGKQSYNVAEWKNSTIHYDVKLMSSFNFDPEYFIAARKAKINVSHLEKMFKENEKKINQKQKEKITKIISINEKDVKRKCVFYHGHWELWEEK